MLAKFHPAGVRYSMFTSKAQGCTRCRKGSSLSLILAKTNAACPFCGKPANASADKPFRPVCPSGKRRRLWLSLFLMAALAGAGGYLFLKSGATGVSPLKTLSVMRQLRFDRLTVAPAPARVRGARATIVVKGLRYGCPDIYHVALSKTLPTETPVCCVDLEITNTGEKPVEYHSWRDFEAYADQKRAALTEGNGSPIGLVSFGIETYPAGAWRQAGIPPGATIFDTVLFICNAKPASDLQLTLPCENLGGKGDLRFTIPCALIQ